MPKKNLVIVGAGGFAREVKWLAESLNEYTFVGFVVSDLEKLGSVDSREEILGDYDWLSTNKKKWDALVLGTGSPKARLKIVGDIHQLFGDIDWPTLIHPRTVWDEKTCEIGRGVTVCANTVLTVNVRIEEFALINLSCTIGHEARIGRGSVLNPAVNISGGVKIGDGVLVGTGAQVLQYLNIGEESTIGAGAVVTKDVNSGDTVIGIPARPLAGK